MNEAEPAGRQDSADGPQSDPERQRPQPRIYVASLSDYNAGRLHGAWIDAAQEPDELLGDIDRMLSASPTRGAEEWAIHDYEGFGGLRLSEFESMGMVSLIARGVVEHDVAFAAWAAHVGTTDTEVLNRFEDAYLGEWSSLEAYAEELLSDLGYDRLLDEVIPEPLRPYVAIDVAGFARDLQLSGDVSVVDQPSGEVWIFDGRL